MPLSAQLSENAFLTIDLLKMYTALKPNRQSSDILLLNQISAAMAREIGREDISLQEHTSLIANPNPSAELRLPAFPLVSVTSATILNVDGTPGRTIDPANIWISNAKRSRIMTSEGWPSTAVFTGYGSLRIPGPTVLPLIQVVYQAGWVTPEQSLVTPNPPVTLPEDLQAACAEAFMTIRASMGRDAYLNANNGLQAYSMRRDFLPPSVKAVCRAYKPMVPR